MEAPNYILLALISIIGYFLRDLHSRLKDTISDKEVFCYLCYSNPIKNIIALINFFATNSGYDLSTRSSLCFTIFNNLLI